MLLQVLQVCHDPDNQKWGLSGFLHALGPVLALLNAHAGLEEQTNMLPPLAGCPSPALLGGAEMLRAGASWEKRRKLLRLWQKPSWWERLRPQPHRLTRPSTQDGAI